MPQKTQESETNESKLLYGKAVSGYAASILFGAYAGNLSKGSINTYQAAIRFFFGVTLNRSMNYLQMPRFKGGPDASRNPVTGTDGTVAGAL